MSKQRNQANKQKQNKTKHVTQMKSSSLRGGLYPFGDGAPPLVNTNKSKTKMQKKKGKRKKFQILQTRE
jgi:hypothetical protein